MSASLEPALRRRRSDAPLLRRLEERVGAVDVRRTERVVDPTALVQEVGHGVGEHDVGAGTKGKVHVGARRHPGATRVDHDERRTALPRLP